MGQGAVQHTRQSGAISDHCTCTASLSRPVVGAPECPEVGCCSLVFLMNQVWPLIESQEENSCLFFLEEPGL